jgi:hypothetical protein
MDKRLKFETVIKNMSNKEIRRHEQITSRKGLNITKKVKDWIRDNA